MFVRSFGAVEVDLQLAHNLIKCKLQVALFIRQEQETMADFDPVFSKIARDYDKYCDIFSIFIHRYWKSKFADRINKYMLNECLDLASGTGDIPFRAAKIIPQKDRAINFIVSDTCEQMLEIAKEKLGPIEYNALRFDYRILDATNLASIKSNSCELISMSFAMKIIDRSKAMTEIMRCLKPGGVFLNIDASKIPIGFMQNLYLKYMNLVLPLMGRIIANGNKDAYIHLLNGISEFPGHKELSKEFVQHGFEVVEEKLLSFGIVAIHCVLKPQPNTYT